MATHLASTPMSLQDKYHALLQLDLSSCTPECLQKYYDALHSLSLQITLFDIDQLKKANDAINNEMPHFHVVIEKLKQTAVTDDVRASMLNAINHTLNIAESLVPVTF